MTYGDGCQNLFVSASNKAIWYQNVNNDTFTKADFATAINDATIRT